MGKTVAISADSTCDLTPELAKQYHIELLPLYVTFGETSYRDGIDITPDEIYKKYETEGQLPKTSAMNVGEYADYFAAQLKHADSLIHFSISSGMSSTHQNATIAAREFEGRVFTVDTLNLSTAEALTVIHTAELIEGGATAEEAVAAANAYAEGTEASFVIESLEFLYKGGRCSALSALGANLLNIKPCIEVTDGKMDVGKKYRGKFKAVLQKYIEERLAAAGAVDPARAFVTHAGCSDDVVELCRSLVAESGLFNEVLVTRAGCTVSSHCGPNTLGLMFAHKQ